MDGNSQKPGAFPVSTAVALAALQDWLRREGGNQKTPVVLGLLADKTRAALERGEEPPAVDPETLRDLYLAERGGSSGASEARRWLLRSEVAKWWSERQRQIELACRAAGADCGIALEVTPGGGRGNATTYRLAFVPMNLEPDDLMDAPPGDPSRIIYEIEPAKAALWLRMLVGRAPFRMYSWRGLIVIALITLPVLALLLFWTVVLIALAQARPMHANDVVLLFLAAGLTGFGIFWLRPLVRLPHERVTIASDVFLAFSQMHGQFRLSRDAMSKVKGGWFSVVRHWGTCPICSAQVELRPGGRAFPERIVGRCSDSPLEHVYSFDPVSLTGRVLR